MSNRVYSEEEVALLIRRAVELESERTKEGGTGDQKGLTMEDLEKIAADSGIDPELMHKAAEELDTPDALPNLEESTKVNKSEIVAEHWIKIPVNGQIYDDLITELNHRFGTSQDDISWWDNLFNDYSGKAVVSKTQNSADWRYTDEMELYTTRVLLQKRGDKLRIRVGKRIGWGMSWRFKGAGILIGLFSALPLSIIGSSLSFAFFDTVIPGIITALSLSVLITPLSLKYSRHRLEHYKKEVSDIAESLVTQAERYSEELFTKDSMTSGMSSTHSNLGDIEIDIDSEPESSQNDVTGDSGRLKNHLRG